MKLVGLLAVAALLTVAGCGSKEPATLTQPSTPSSAGATADPSAGLQPSTSASASPSSPNHFTVDGTGVYQIGATLAALQTAGQVADVKGGSQTCAQNTTARGTGAWSDVRVSARPDGKIYLVVNRSATIPTPSGAWLGNTLAALQSIYGPIGEELSQGGSTAYLVNTISGRGILFDLDPGTKKVNAMIAGEAAYLKTSYLGGTDYC
jgi:predicted small lipoprotein YifL